VKTQDGEGCARARASKSFFTRCRSERISSGRPDCSSTQEVDKAVITGLDSVVLVGILISKSTSATGQSDRVSS
jgi:hypothetical protein